jgi:ADP-ribosylglycohydrolase
VPSPDLTCGAATCEPTRTRPGQAFNPRIHQTTGSIHELRHCHDCAATGAATGATLTIRMRRGSTADQRQRPASTVAARVRIERIMVAGSSLCAGLNLAGQHPRNTRITARAVRVIHRGQGADALETVPTARASIGQEARTVE